MAVKTITITVEAYNALSRAKHPHESFSETVRRLAEHSVPLSDFAGAWEALQRIECRKSSGSSKPQDDSVGSSRSVEQAGSQRRDGLSRLDLRH